MFVIARRPVFFPAVAISELAPRLPSRSEAEHPLRHLEERRWLAMTTNKQDCYAP